MNKQEEIDRILTKHTGKTGSHLDMVKRELSEAGVVIKVDRELPELEHPKYLERGITSDEDLLKFAQAIELATKIDVLKAGYVAVEPLIKGD